MNLSIQFQVKIDTVTKCRMCVGNVRDKLSLPDLIIKTSLTVSNGHYYQ